jgi:hypothetical protein
MAAFVLDASQVGQVVTYVAPGFLAQLGYQARYPAPERSAGRVLIVSVVLSLPLVAVADLMHGSHKPTRLLYVLALTAGSFALGYLLACVRGRKWAKWLLAWAGYRIQPEDTIYAQTLKHMSDAATVLVELKDGRRVRGTPRCGPETQDDGINELYLTHPEAERADSTWYSPGAGVIVPLGEVSNIVLSEDPTGAPTAETAAGPAVPAVADGAASAPPAAPG